MIEPAGFGPGKKCERDDAHGFLSVIGAVTVRHPGRAYDLRLSEKLMDKKRGEFVKQNEEQKHYETAENESRDRRRNHRHNNLRPNTGIPFDDRPISVRGRERRAAQTAD